MNTTSGEALAEEVEYIRRWRNVTYDRGSAKEVELKVDEHHLQRGSVEEFEYLRSYRNITYNRDSAKEVELKVKSITSHRGSAEVIQNH